MTLYVCTDKDAHRPTRLGRFTDDHLERLNSADGADQFLMDMRDLPKLSMPFGEDTALAVNKLYGERLHPRRRSLFNFGGGIPVQPVDVMPDTGRLVFRNGHGVGIFKCPRCGRDKRISEEKLRAVFAAGFREVDISRI